MFSHNFFESKINFSDNRATVALRTGWLLGTEFGVSQKMDKVDWRTIAVVPIPAWTGLDEQALALMNLLYKSLLAFDPL